MFKFIRQCQGDPGPGHYEAERRPATVATVTHHPFGVSVSCADKQSQRFFLGSNNPVGAGQYIVDSGQKHRHANGCKSVFSSTTPHVPENVDSPKKRLLRERIQPKSIPAKERQFLIPVETPC